MIRKTIFWTHLVIGLLSGLFIFILCLTGAILAFELQIVDSLEHDARARPASADAKLLPPAEIVASAKKVEKEAIQSIEWFSDPTMPVRVRSNQRTITLVNGYTGEVLGRGAVGTRKFMRWTTELHTNLTSGPVGGQLIAWSNFIFVFIIVSGLWLWWPRQWRWGTLRNSMAVRFDVQGKARDWNWHNALGFWFLLPLLFIATTGLALSFRAVDQWWRSFGGTQVLAAAQPSQKPAATGDKAGSWPQWIGLIQQQQPGWRSIMLGGEGKPNKEGLLGFTVYHGTQRQATRVVNVRLDPNSGQIVEVRQWNTNDNSQRARNIVRLGHTGEFFGNGGQFIALLACLAGCVLVYTGFALSWRRFFRRGPADAATAASS